MPARHQKRMVEFGEWLCGNVVKAVPHRHVVFGIPKILRRHFLYNRKLLSGLSRCAWEAFNEYLQSASSSGQLRPAAVNAIQTFGDFLGYNPHCHMLVADGGFHENSAFTVAPAPAGKQMLMTGSYCPPDPELSQEETQAWADAGEELLFGAFPEM